MEMFAKYLTTIEDPEHRSRVEVVLSWALATYPTLQPRIAWNQPMLTDHGTFIIGFSVSKGHMSVSPEQAGMRQFTDEIAAAGYSQTANLFRIPWDTDVDYDLLSALIQFNIDEKADCDTFWKK